MPNAFLVPNDVLGRLIVQFGTAQKVDLTDPTLKFVPIFTCGDRQFPATGQKKIVVSHVGFSNFTVVPFAGVQMSCGSASAGTDLFNSTDLSLWSNGTQPFLVVGTSIGQLGMGGYTPGTVFGTRVTVPGTGTVDVTAYGWAA